MFDRAAITDKALLGKASKYNDSPSIFVGGGDLSSSLPSSSYGWALAAGGSSSLGGLVVVDGEGDQDLLSIILADSSSWEMATKEEKTLAEIGVGNSDERLVDEGPLQDMGGGGSYSH